MAAHAEAQEASFAVNRPVIGFDTSVMNDSAFNASAISHNTSIRPLTAAYKAATNDSQVRLFKGSTFKMK